MTYKAKILKKLQTKLFPMTKTKQNLTNIFPDSVSTITKEKLTALAQEAFSKPIESLTKEDIRILIQMDIATTINKLTVSAAATRPTDIKFATNNYFASMEIDIAGYSKIIKDILDNVPEDKILDKYLDIKQVVYNMIRLKYESTENYLRSLLDSAITRDGCPKVGRDTD